MHKSISYEQVLDYIYRTSPNRSPLKTGSDYSLDRIVKLLAILDNPQNKFKTIHIAGTSGKGSTAVILSEILGSQGFKVGLTLSPHLTDIRERLQINNKLYEKGKFARNFNAILPFIEKINLESTFPVSFFEMMIALVYYTFAQEKVDYAVVETGLGGTLDATNTIRRDDKLCVITRIGLDHTKILGSTITKIALQKAGIIGDLNEVITCEQDKKVISVLNNRCEKTNSDLILVKQGENYTKVGISRFTYEYGGICINNVKLGLEGDFQIENTSLALTALVFLSKRDGFKINTIKLLSSLKTTKYPGRFETFITGNKKIIVDGAHNPQKMKAFIGSLISAYPNQLFDFYIAVKEDKDYIRMLEELLPYASRVFVSDYKIKNVDIRVESIPAKVLKKQIIKLGFPNVKIIQLEDISSQIMRNKADSVITGSLYFISEIYIRKPVFRNK